MHLHCPIVYFAAVTLKGEQVPWSSSPPFLYTLLLPSSEQPIQPPISQLHPTTMFADAVRRGLSHPHTASFVKRAVTIQGEGEHEKIEILGWSFALLYVSFMASMVFMTLVSTLPLS
jgi:hypothetical protein